MRVGDVLVSVDGKDVLGATLPTALSMMETARRRVSECAARGITEKNRRFATVAATSATKSPICTPCVDSINPEVLSVHSRGYTERHNCNSPHGTVL